MLAYKRTQVLLEPKQHEALADLATEEERSVSDLFREIVTNFLEERAAKNKRRETLAAVERLAAFRKELANRLTEPLPDTVDLLNEMREERMADFERVWRGEE